MDFYARGIQGFEQGRARAVRNRLGELSSAALAAPIEQRGQFAAQIGALDPEAGFAMEQDAMRATQAAQAENERKLRGMAGLLASVPQQARGSLYARVRPGLQQMGFDAPEAWSDDLMPVVQQFAGVGQSQQASLTPSMQSLIWQRDNKVIGEDEFRQAVRILNRQDAAAQNQQFSPQRIEQADGTVRIDLVPTRGGNVVGGAFTGAAAQPPARGATPNMDAILAQANVLARQGVPDAQIEQFIAQSAQRQGVQMTPAGGMTPEMESAASATLDRQTFGASDGQATNASRAAAAADAAAQRVRAEELARSEAGRINDAPKAIREGEMLIQNIDALLDDPNLDTATGLSGIVDPRSWWGINRASGVADTLARINQIQGSAFLQAFESLKGGGAITEVEGKKAEQAIARLTSAQSDEGFRQALLDFRAAIAPGIERARRRLQGGDSLPADSNSDDDLINKYL